tara:strand:- start:215 stop:3217 length:3003 start_codon:yes stop_codon:yes gene_type:complete
MTKRDKNDRYTKWLKRLVEKPIEIAIDTEYQDAQTLTVQAAARNPAGNIMVHLFHSPSIPSLPDDFDQEVFLPTSKDNSYGKFCQKFVIRKPSKLNIQLSPVRILRSLLRLPHLKAISKAEIEPLIQDRNQEYREAKWDSEKEQWKLPTIRIVLIGHFLTADIGRLFGSSFNDSLFHRDSFKSSSIRLDNRSKLEFIEEYANHTVNNPIIEYAKFGSNRLYQVRIETRDTMLPYGKSNLGTLSDIFINQKKDESISKAEKATMLKTFRTKTNEAYGYAIVDVVNTLLVYEQMKEYDTNIYREFKVPESNIPEMSATIGSRVKDFIISMTSLSISNSQNLSTTSEVKKLMRKSGVSQFHGQHSTSRFGPQTGRFHGGLAFSRTPTTIWHRSPGMLRDVDFAGCYNKILANMNVYWGRPIILEPGSNNLALTEGVDIVRKVSQDDAWYIRVTGDFEHSENVLIPSTLEAMTFENYRQKVGHERITALLKDVERSEEVENSGAKLFARRIESGIVTYDTWMMIQALPESMRSEYEQLRVESIVFYDKRRIAKTGEEFDQLIEENRTKKLPWNSEYLESEMSLIHKEPIDHDYVAYQFPIKKYAREIGEKRREAKEKHGKGSDWEYVWKMQANTMFGVLVCKHHPTNNIVGGNIIGARARSQAYAMIQSLNGLQVITDGCTYRRDRIPACTFSECLKIMSDYPLRHADEESGIPFYDPAEIPVDDRGFSNWYQEHLKHFFEVSGKEYDKFFGMNILEHKATGGEGPKSFDAIACDGCSNYIKFLEEEDGLEIKENKMRSFSTTNKNEYGEWIMMIYPEDNMIDLPPITTDRLLLKLKPAKQFVKKVMKNNPNAELYLPLSLELKTVKVIKHIKLSAFIFQTPKQYELFTRQVDRFQEKTSCGLDLLVLRQSKGERQRGSIEAVLTEIYDYIQQGGRDLTKKLNLREQHLAEKLRTKAARRREQVRRLKDEAEAELLTKIDMNTLDKAEIITGILINSHNLNLIL